MERKERRPILKRDLAHMILVQKFVENLFIKLNDHARKILMFRSLSVHNSLNHLKVLFINYAFR